MNYHFISKNDMNNGEGLRCVLWVAGCAHQCPGCHNGFTWCPESGKHFDESAIEVISEQLEEDYISGITYSGGDPFHPSNLGEIVFFAKSIRERYPKKTQWLYTGMTWEVITKCIDPNYLSNFDVIVDGKFELENISPHLKWVGSSNQRVIDVKKSLEKGEVVLYNN